MRTTAKGLVDGKSVHVKGRDARKSFNGSMSKRPPIVKDGVTFVHVLHGRTGNTMLVRVEDVRAFQPGRRVAAVGAR